jgi:hypothetical protein
MRSGSVSVVGSSGEDGMGSIDLFEGDDESKFVLKRERAERPEQVRAFDDARGEAVCASDEKGTCFSGIALDFPYLLGKRAAAQAFASLVQDQAKASFAPAEQLSAFTRWIRWFDVGCLDSAEAPQAGEVFGNARAGVGQARFTDRDDAPAQG